MHERGSDGGLDRVFWDLVDGLAGFPDLAVTPFYFHHRSAPIEKRSGECYLGSTSLSAGLSRTDHEGAIGWLLLVFVSLEGIYKKSC
jgi:hypothetical protein